jgi:fucose permease
MSNSTQVSLQTTKKTFLPILIIAGLFFIFGFVTWINGALIPFMKTINELTDAQSYLVASASYISFVVMALPASYLINKIGYKNGMSIGLLIIKIPFKITFTFSVKAVKKDGEVITSIQSVIGVVQ